MSYECDSIIEFKKYAFGKTITPKWMYVSVSPDWAQSIISIFAPYNKGEETQEFVLISSDEMLIISLRDALRMNKKVSPQPKKTVVIKVEDNSVHIGNNNNLTNNVIGSKNNIEMEQKNTISEAREESWISKLFWNVPVPIIVGIIIAAICLALGLTQ